MVKLPRANKGEDREKEKIRVEKNDTLGSIVVERNAREERARDGLGGGPRPRA